MVMVRLARVQPGEPLSATPVSDGSKRCLSLLMVSSKGATTVSPLTLVLGLSMSEVAPSGAWACNGVRVVLVPAWLMLPLSTLALAQAGSVPRLQGQELVAVLRLMVRALLLKSRPYTPPSVMLLLDGSSVGLTRFSVTGNTREAKVLALSVRLAL